MKVAHIAATFPPYMAGTGNVAYNQALVLHERGYDVTVFTAEPSGGLTNAQEVPFEVRYLPAVFRLGNAPLTPSLLHVLRGFDLIHLHYPYIFGAELTLAAAKRYHIPYVITYHNQLLQPGSWKQGLFSYLNVLSCFLTLLQCFKVFRFGSLSNGLPSPSSRERTLPCLAGSRPDQSFVQLDVRYGRRGSQTCVQGHFTP